MKVKCATIARNLSMSHAVRSKGAAAGKGGEEVNLRMNNLSYAKQRRRNVNQQEERDGSNEINRCGSESDGIILIVRGGVKIGI